MLEEFRPQAVAIEQVFSLTKNPKSALLMAHARGALLFAMADAGLDVVHYSPKQVKKLLTGSGTADKSQIQQAVQRELGFEPDPGAERRRRRHRAIALCHYHKRPDHAPGKPLRQWTATGPRRLTSLSSADAEGVSLKTDD